MLDETYSQADGGDDSLQNFFSRPIKTQSYSWGTGDATPLFETFNPWTDFFENPRVINRITNFNLLRCKLCVKFILNGNGFHYGRSICSYTPLHNDDGFTKDRAFFSQDIVEASQRPHIYLDPTNSQGGTMCLPFVWRYNALSIPNQDWRDMGDIIIHELEGLKHANGATDQVTISVFVWAEDVQLSVPTANEPGALSAQAGEYDPQADEYGDGIISRPASMIARAAGALKNAPVIGMYARATEIGAGAAASIAKMFGFSRPNNLTDIMSYKPVYAGNLANTNMADTAYKLSYDAKQELTCDTRTMGLDGTDEMSILSIATRESYLTKFPWAVADTTETLLWSGAVNPVIFDTLNQGGATEFHMPACCFAALPFEYWRGTMKFRFQIVASAFHKGRIKVVYDPSFPLTNEYNTNYTRIIDLADERDFTIEIGWGQEFPYCQHLNMLDQTDASNVHRTTAFGNAKGVFANGIISLYVVNELTVPNSTADNDIEVNVFVSAGEDFEVAVPNEEYVRELSWFAPQSGEYVPQAGEENIPDSDNTEMENAPMKLEADEMLGAVPSPTDHTMDIFFADPVASVRQVLKRYNFSRAYTLGPGTTGTYLTTLVTNNFPFYRGYDFFGEDQVTTPVNPSPYTFATTTMLNYFTPAYTCYRGGIRWKYLLSANDAMRNLFMSVRRSTSLRAYSLVNEAIPLTADSQSTVARFWAQNLTNLHDGAFITPISQNPVAEVEFPFYRNQRFGFAKDARLDAAGDDEDYHLLQVAAQQPSTSAMGHILGFVAASEDYTLGFYTGPPVAYKQVDPGAVS
ncbi:MAG: hypothetical protein 2 [Marnaviridae sp.]|nr:MAG: hypothetical protein 2 [Marnaviridae sp.]